MFNPFYKDWEWNQTAVRTYAYEESEIVYDKNGNIKFYVRNDESGNVMDDLEYSYYTGTNQLETVLENAGTTSNPDDIENQLSGNYTYDAIGNLISDNSEGLTIFWNNFGKVDSISDSNDDIALKFVYDPSGNRIEKRFYPSNSQPNIREVTYYIRDAQGNILANYSRSQDYSNQGGVPYDDYYFRDWHLYGSSRLGLASNHVLLASTSQLITWVSPLTNLREGNRVYELTNHLGNVLATVPDIVSATDTSNDADADFNVAYIQSAQDYYPFGMIQPGRTVATSGYRFGFNGMEKDDEIKGSGNHLDFKYRGYDPRTGRFWSVDPLFKEYPWNSTYAFAENRVIDGIDLEGLEYLNANGEPAGPLNDVEASNRGATLQPGFKNESETNASKLSETDIKLKKDLNKFAAQKNHKIPPANSVNGQIKQSPTNYDKWLKMVVAPETESMARDNPIIKSFAVGTAAFFGAAVGGELVVSGTPYLPSLPKIASATSSTVRIVNSTAIAIQQSTTARVAIGIGVGVVGETLDLPIDEVLSDPITQLSSQSTSLILKFIKSIDPSQTTKVPLRNSKN